ncbi:MAG: DUF1848 domain-containing protein [Mailhella sp.]|nr:DUF1848 domain-containing protein [Mailhella sp.]
MKTESNGSDKHLDINVRTAGGETTVKALAPVIVSASRSTDIPAFYADWMANRLRAKYCVWYNPFNRKPSYVSFERARAFVFWSKNPAPLIPVLPEFDKKGIGYYFQFTLNDYMREGFEPNVGPLEKRIETFRTLASKIGRERVIWRFDPVVMGPGLDPETIAARIGAIGSRLKGHTEKLVFSFVDVAAYRKVQTNMAKTALFGRENVLSAEASEKQIGELCERLAALRDRWKREGWDVTLATCAEKADLAQYGIEHNRCVDDALLRRLYPDDAKLMEYLRPMPVKGSLLAPAPAGGSGEAMPVYPACGKDQGQRKECGCVTSKDIGMYDTCAHFCAYCYANSSSETVRRNRARHSPDSESIIGE